MAESSEYVSIKKFVEENERNDRLEEEYERYDRLEAQYKRMQAEYEEELQELEERSSRALEELKGYYEAKLQKKVSQLQKKESQLQKKVSQLQWSQEESQKNLKEFEETTKMIEEDGDQEIQNMKLEFEQRFREEHETRLRLEEEHYIQRLKFTKLQEDMEERSKEIEKMTAKEQDMQKLIQTLKEDIEHLESELEGKDETIENMVNENSDLMKTIQELEKYKHVGDYMMQEQKKKIEEQEKDIKEKTEKIQGIDDEFLGIQEQRKQLQCSISKMKFKLKKENEATVKKRQKVRDLEKLVKSIQRDLQNCVGFIQEPKVLKQKICELHARYVHKSDVAELVGANVDVLEEYEHCQEHLLRTVKTLRRELKDLKETHRVDNMRLMQENVTLGKEINDLRQELKLSRTKVQELEKEKALQQYQKKHPLLSADSKGFAGVGRKSSGVLQLKPVEETTKKIVLPQIKIKGLMKPEKSPPGSVPSRVGKLPALRLSR